MKRPALLLVILLSVSFLPIRVCLGEPDPAAAELLQTPERGSLPIWTQPDQNSLVKLGSLVREMQKSVMIVGHEQGGHGTAFVISREHRLLATNAHVADIMVNAGGLTAVSSETGAKYEVDQVWYHPGVVRQASGTRLLMRSMDASVGPVHPLCPDLAVLHLAEGGPPLPEPLTLASPAEIEKLFGEPMGIIGYPGHDSHFPQPGELTGATYHQGVVSRLSDFNHQAAADWRDQQFVQHTAPTWFGFSGSPIFLINGHVMAVHNSGRSYELRGLRAQLSKGVRVDCLWELIAWHGLEAEFPLPIERSRLNLARYQGTDPAFEKYRQVAEMVVEADDLNFEQKFAEAAARCKQAIQILPEYPLTYAVRTRAFTNYAFTYIDRLSSEVMVEQVTQALKDAQKYAELAPGDPMAPTLVAMAINNVAGVEFRLRGASEQNRAKRRQAIAIADKVLSTSGLTNDQSAQAYTARATARAALEDYRGALADYNEAIRLTPAAPEFYENRAYFFELTGRNRDAIADRRRAKQLREQALAAPQWREFVSAADGFRAVFPAEPQKQNYANEFRSAGYLATSQTLGLEFLVAFGEFPQAAMDQLKTEDERLDALTQLIRQRGKILDEKPIRFAGQSARELQVTSEGEKMIFRQFVVGNRYYQCVVGGAPETLSAQSDVAQRFFDSFALLAAPTAPPPPQPVPPTSPVPPTEPEPVRRWTDFRWPDGGFQVRMPGKPQAESQRGDDFLHHRFTVTDEQQATVFLVDYVDFSGEQAEKHPTPEARLDFVRDKLVAQAKLASEKGFRLAGLPGRDLVIQRSDGGTTVVRLLVSGERFYQIVVSGPGESVSPDAEDVRKFIDSFTLLPVMD